VITEDEDGGYAGILGMAEGLESELVHHRHRVAQEASVTAVLDLLSDVADLTRRIRVIRYTCERNLNGAAAAPSP
jgi:hypothetical protein